MMANPEKKKKGTRSCEKEITSSRKMQDPA